MTKKETQEKLEKFLAEKNIPQKAMHEIKRTIKVISSMPGIEKENLEFNIKDESVKIHAKNGSRNYHAMVPIKERKE